MIIWDKKQDVILIYWQYYTWIWLIYDAHFCQRCLTLTAENNKHTLLQFFNIKVDFYIELDNCLTSNNIRTNIILRKFDSCRYRLIPPLRVNFSLLSSTLMGVKGAKCILFVLLKSEIVLCAYRRLRTKSRLKHCLVAL